jgi:membrane protein DedA with SNARE-associated domain
LIGLCVWEINKFPYIIYILSETIQFLIRHGYAVLFLWVLFEQMGLPIPAALLLLAPRALAGLGKLNFAIVFGFALVASLLSDIFLYHIGLRRSSKALSLLYRISILSLECYSP